MLGDNPGSAPSVIERSVPSRNNTFAKVLLLSFAGIIRIRFKGFDLSPSNIPVALWI